MKIESNITILIYISHIYIYALYVYILYEGFTDSRNAYVYATEKYIFVFCWYAIMRDVDTCAGDAQCVFSCLSVSSICRALTQTRNDQGC